MKTLNKFSLLFTFLSITFLFFSCQKEICYSCDESIDTWVKQNKELINTFNRTDLVSLNHEKQIAAYRFISKEKKKAIWLEKFSVLKNSILTDEEKKHFEFVDNFIEEINFEKGISYDEEKKFFQWFNKGKEIFKWNDEFLIKVFASLNDLNNYRAIDDIGEDKDCVCRWDTACDMSGLGECDDKIKCEDTALGCGLLFLQSCTGRCSG